MDLETKIKRALKDSCANRLRSLDKLMASDDAWATGRVEGSRNKLITWCENNVPGAEDLSYLKLEELVEEMAEVVSNA